MVSYKTKLTPVRRIEEMIFLVRGQRVMLDFDLAAVYGVTTKQLNQQFKRNRDRFPDDFAFELTLQEFTQMRSQNVTASKRNIRHVPVAFTEHGALMLGNVLNSKVAMEASVRVVRTFVLMREQLAASKEFTQKLDELEQRVSGHDAAIANLFEAIRQLVEPPLPENRRQIGFMCEATTPYHIRRSCRN